MDNIKIKKTSKQDSKLFYQLRNDKFNRKFFSNSKNIKFDEHKKWFERNFKKNYYFTCFYNKSKIGYIRGDNLDESIFISIAIDKKFRKKNIATKCFKLFEKKIKVNSILFARVLKKNMNSIKFFEKNKFSLLRLNKNILTYYKIHHKDYEKYLSAITKIENIRKGNNINWMNVLRVAFTNSPFEASKIFKKIYSDDKTINFLSKKLF
ncbi:GNAT family N-acetyltransferase [Candidatus Pelagibacter sp.]|nr:GNAT family N-acetyltransferase [Candidatus Pelagibacter sp.]